MKSVPLFMSPHTNKNSIFEMNSKDSVRLRLLSILRSQMTVKSMTYVRASHGESTIIFIVILSADNLINNQSINRSTCCQLNAITIALFSCIINIFASISFGTATNFFPSIHRVPRLFAYQYINEKKYGDIL